MPLLFRRGAETLAASIASYFDALIIYILSSRNESLDKAVVYLLSLGYEMLQNVHIYTQNWV